jgi:hypothetical protein
MAAEGVQRYMRRHMSVATDVDVDLEALWAEPPPECEIIYYKTGKCEKPAAWSATMKCPDAKHAQAHMYICNPCRKMIEQRDMRWKCNKCNAEASIVWRPL